MSTTYYDLARPFTAIRIERQVSFNIVSLYTGDGRSPAGRIALTDEELSDFLYQQRGEEVGYRSAGPYGATRFTDRSEPRCDQVISEAGDVVHKRELTSTARWMCHYDGCFARARHSLAHSSVQACDEHVKLYHAGEWHGLGRDDPRHPEYSQ